MRATFMLAELLILAGCKPTDDGNGQKADVVKPTEQDNSTPVMDYKDPDTGCHYIVWNGGMTPKLGKNGKPFCD